MPHIPASDAQERSVLDIINGRSLTPAVVLEAAEAANKNASRVATERS